ncbi:methyltransferase domain-containing protein [Rheinheimera sp.]|uniref:methyltransferase domain-containing protein n=1 Tax=Rheinheimera sp. TaxID=1869214 RepID=UPI003AF7EA43
MTKKIHDQSFDGIAVKFAKNIYETSKGKLRQAVLLRDLLERPELASNCRILDVGAGQGQLALELASRGHQLTLTDLSAEMLELAAERAEQQQLQIQCHQLPLQQLTAQGWPAFPVVLCHAVLEWLEDPAEAIAQLYQLVEPGGLVSLMFYNKDAKRLSNIIYGNFNYVLRDLTYKKKVKLSPQNPLQPQQVELWCQQAGFDIVQKTGVRCFHDYLRDRSEQETEYEQLLQVELMFNRQEPYASLGRYQHLLLRAL